MFKTLIIFLGATFIAGCGPKEAPSPANMRDVGKGDTENKGSGRDLPDRQRPIPEEQDEAAANFKECEQFQSEFSFSQTLDSKIGKFSGKYEALFGTKNYAATFLGRLDLSMSNADISDASNGSLRSVDVERATAQAKKDLAAKQQFVSGSKMPLEARKSIIKSDNSWGQIRCVSHVVSTIDSTTTSGIKVEFTPALPMAIFPNLNAETYDAEIGDGRTFSNITAVVVDGSNEILKNGAAVAGSVSIYKIAPEMTYTDAAGKQVKINADKAFEVSYSFGEAKVTRALGLRPVTKYFIDTKTKTFVAVYVDWLDRNFMQPILYAK